MGWLITFGILALLAILPLGAKVVYDASGFGLDVIAGPIRIPILPKKKDAPKKEKKKIKRNPQARRAKLSLLLRRKRKRAVQSQTFCPLSKQRWNC